MKRYNTKRCRIFLVFMVVFMMFMTACDTAAPTSVSDTDRPAVSQEQKLPSTPRLHRCSRSCRHIATNLSPKAVSLKVRKRYIILTAFSSPPMLMKKVPSVFFPFIWRMIPSPLPRESQLGLRKMRSREPTVNRVTRPGSHSPIQRTI